MHIVLPRDASLDGHLVDGAIGYLTLTTGIAFAAALGFLLVAIVFHRARAGRTRGHHTHGLRPRDRALMFTVALVMFVAIDVTLALRTSRDLETRFWRYPDADPTALRVEVTARQWAWTFRTAGPDGRFGTRRRRRDPERARHPGRAPHLPQAPLARRGALALPAELPHQDRRHPGDDDAPLVPGDRARALRDRLRAALRREPLQDAGPAERPPGVRLPRLAGARRDRQPPPLRRSGPATGAWDWETGK